MRRRITRTPDGQMTVRQAIEARILNIGQRLDLSVGVAPDTPNWDGYTHVLTVYRMVRDDLRTKWRERNPNRDREPFAELLHRVALRCPDRNVEELGAELYARRFGSERQEDD